MMTFVAWKQSYSRFSEQLDFSGSEIICIFRLLKFMCIVQVNFWHNSLSDKLLGSNHPVLSVEISS